MLNPRKRVLMLSPVIAIALAALPTRAAVREEFHKSVAMDANGTFSLKNVNGGVTISAWDKNEVQIDAVKSASSEERLRAARIELAGSGHSVDVPRYPDHTNNPASVESTIHLPWGTHLLDVETVNGEIHIDGPPGRSGQFRERQGGSLDAAEEVELSSVNGEVKASLSNAGKSRVKLNVVNGSISIALPASTNARVKATTVHGEIHSDFPLQVGKSQYTPGANVYSTLGSSGATIELESVNGSICLRKS